VISSPSSGMRLPGIEGVRAIAAGSILVFHVWLYSSPDGALVNLGRIGSFVPDLQFGVALFFALSGFLLYWPFAGGILRGDGGPGIRRYLRNRALRILPAYWVILLLCALLLQSVLRPGGSSGALRDPLLLGQSLLFVQNYSPDQVVTGIGPAWSLNVEVVFYLLLPLLAVLAFALSRRLGRVPAALAPAAFLLLLGLTGKAIAAYVVPPLHPFDGWESDWHSVIERSFLGQADLFAFGMALAVVRVLWEDGRVRLPAWWRLPTTLVAGSALLLIAAEATNSGEQLSYSPWNTVVALDLAVLLALVVLQEGRERPAPGLVRLLEWRPLVIVGVVSYSLFLWHEPLVRWLQAHGLTASGPPGFFLNLAVTASIALLLSVATYRLVEAPSLRLRARATPPRDPEAAVAAVAEISAAP
jgi:peptidoglycan/LPS O-acetylase OafA/YrhL